MKDIGQFLKDLWQSSNMTAVLKEYPRSPVQTELQKSKIHRKGTIWGAITKAQMRRHSSWLLLGIVGETEKKVCN